MPDYTDLIGAPFECGGRGPKTYDCYGLVMEMSRRNGIELPDFGAHKDKAIVAAMMGAALPLWEEIEPRSGAVVLFRVDGLFMHVGYVLDRMRFIHTWEKSGGVTIERLDAWKHRTVGFYRYVGTRS